MMDGPTLQIEIDGKTEELTRVGAAALSVVYQTPAAWYRVYPAEIPLKWKAELRSQVHQVAPAGVKSVRFWQDTPTGRYVLRYERRPGSLLLSEAIESGDVLSGLEGVAASLRAISGWWSQWQAPLLLMPSDIVLQPAGVALLLHAPRFRLPTVAELFEEPARSAFLAPELFLRESGADAAAGRAQDLYALGVSLLSCFFDAEGELEPAEALLRAATALAPQSSQWRDTLPFWIEKVEPTRRVIALGHGLAARSPAERLSLDLTTTAEYLSNCRRRMEPCTAVREARAHDPQQAFTLLEDLLLNDESYELLLEGADLAEYLGHDLQALRLYQRAIERAADRPEAYRRRFDLIAGVWSARSPTFRLLYEQDLEFSTRLDGDIRRDFDALDRLQPRWADEREMTLARHYLRGGRKIWTRYQSARDFIRARVHDSAGTRRAWKLELRLLECEVLLEQGNGAAAAELFNQIVPDINRLAAVNNPLVDRAAVRRASEQAALLRRRLAPPVEPQDAIP